MKKVIVIGCPGSGKSTFARALQKKTGLPLVHLDLLYWNADRTTVSREVFRERLQAALEKDRWIIDGNYNSTMELRLEFCDTVFFLDYPTELCLEGIRSRRGKARADMPWVEQEGQEDAEFFAFVQRYQEESRPAVLALLEKYKDRNILIFKTREEADDYINA